MSKIRKIVFFNGHQHGDIANTRGLVSYISKHIPSSYELCFLHHRNPESILFGENIPVYNQYGHYGREFPFAKLHDIKELHHTAIHFVLDDMVFLNTWIGCSNYYLTNRAPNGHGITRKSLLEQTNECISFLNESIEELDIPYATDEDQTLPIGRQFPRNKDLVDFFLQKVKANYRKLVLIPNGQVESSQTPQFNFGSEIVTLINQNQDVGFIFTAKNFQPQDSNVYFVDDEFPIPNLTEISYLSEKCDILITRASGPGCVVSTINNYYDTSKTFISFTVNPCIAFEGLCSDEEIENKSWGSENTAKMIWSNDFSPENLCKVIGDAIQ